MPKSIETSKHRVRALQLEKSCPIWRGSVSTAWAKAWVHSGVTFLGPTAARPVLEALQSGIGVAVQPVENGAFIEESQFGALSDALALSQKKDHLASRA